MRIRFIFLILIIPVLFRADTWEPPEVQRYFSTNGVYFLEVVPTKIPDKYWQWRQAKPHKKAKFNPEDTTIVHCHARLFKIQGTDTTKLWEQRLINKISPVSAVISEDGQYVVSFDNWYSTGYGLDVMVVYNAKGELLKRYKLEDFSPFPINTYLITISSIRWRCETELVAENKLRICFKDNNGQIKFRTFNLSNLEFE